MHDTEAVGTAYDFCRWDKGAVAFHDFATPEAVYGYSSRLGALCDDEAQPLALLKLPAKERRFTSASQIDARLKLYNSLPDELRKGPQSDFMKQLVSDKGFRLAVNDYLLAQAQPMKQGPWQVIAARTDRAEAFL